VDSRGRKVAFLAAASGLVDAKRCDAQRFRGREARSAAPDLCGACDLVTARAVADVERLLVEARDLLVDGGRLLCYKGPAYRGDEERKAVAVARAHGYVREDERECSPHTGAQARILTVWRR
jgi:16S rRNA G527 N7-methylase RsmG